MAYLHDISANQMYRKGTVAKNKTYHPPMINTGLLKRHFMKNIMIQQA